MNHGLTRGPCDGLKPFSFELYSISVLIVLGPLGLKRQTYDTSVLKQLIWREPWRMAIKR